MRGQLQEYEIVITEMQRLAAFPEDWKWEISKSAQPTIFNAMIGPPNHENKLVACATVYKMIVRSKTSLLASKTYCIK